MHEIGRLYYRGLLSKHGDSFVPVVQTWEYRGVETLKCSSSSCDVPNQFYHFVLVGSEANESLNIPSRDQAEQSMLTWEQFLIDVEELAKEASEP